MDQYYRNENVKCCFETGQLLFDDSLKYFKTLCIYFIVNQRNKMKLSIAIDGDYDNGISLDIEFMDGAYSENDFFNGNFITAVNCDDYREIFINRIGRWIEFKIECDEEYFTFKGYKLSVDNLLSKEG